MADNCTLGCKQEIVPPMTVTFGGVKSESTVAVAVAVQPLEVLVTVTV